MSHKYYHEGGDTPGWQPFPMEKTRTLQKILWYIESKAARDEGVRLNNVEAKRLSAYLDKLRDTDAARAALETNP